MAQVNVTISGKSYRMACDDGQEDHLAGLAERLDRSIEHLRSRFGEIGDLRLTVMAAITLADQHADLERRLHAAEAEIETLHAAHAATGNRRTDLDRGLAERIAAIADRVETLALRAASVPEDIEEP